jgi:hypothetical protein
MVELAHALPKETIEAMVPGAEIKVVATNVKEWKATKPAQLSPLSLFVWDEMVHRGRVKQPFKIAPYTENADYKDGIYSFVQKELGVAPVTKVYAASMYRPGETLSFADVSIVRCWPSDLHICDVEFSDFDKPIAEDDPTSRYRGWHGLHVFPEFLERLIEVAKFEDVKRISLTAAHPPLRQTFEKYGFEVSPTKVAQRAAKIGMGFPMILQL